MSENASLQPPELERIAAAKLDWTLATREGNKLCTTITKLMKTAKDTDNFKMDYILAVNEYLNTIFDIINNKIPAMEEFLELKNLEILHRPDWGKAFQHENELRQPLRSPDAMQNQITQIETNIQLILAKIPDAKEIVGKIKKAYKNGDINRDTDLTNVQGGLTHVSKRVQEIEDLIKLWQKHKDAMTALVTKKNVPLNSRPGDIAGIRFYQFINTNLGTPCYQLIIMDGWPTTEEWKGWEAWWNIQMQKTNQHEDHLGIKAPTTAWPMQVAHTTAMIVQTIYDIHIAAATNIIQIQVEPLMWKIAFIKNALTELFILPKSGDKNWLSNIWEINDQILKEIPTVAKMQKIIESILPGKLKADQIIYASTEAKDLIPFKDQKLTVATVNTPVPKIRTLPENYRLKWEKDSSPNKQPKKTPPKKDTEQKRKRKTITRAPPTLKKEKKGKNKKESDSESSENDSENDSSSDETEKNQAVIIDSSSTEDEDFNC